jgi:hypothetical protein
MTGRTTGHNIAILNLVILDELRPFDRLIEALIRGRPLHLKHLVFRTDKLLRIAVALKTPLHLEQLEQPTPLLT